MTQEEKEILHKKQVENGHKHYENIKRYQLGTRDKDEAKEVHKQGQKASIEVRKSKKNIKSICNELLNMSASDIASNVLNSDIADKLQDTDITLYDLIIAKQIEVALKDGDVKSATFLRDSNGDKPTDKTQTDINVINEYDSQLLQSINDRLDSLEAIDTTPKSE